EAVAVASDDKLVAAGLEPLLHGEVPERARRRRRRRAEIQPHLAHDMVQNYIGPQQLNPGVRLEQAGRADGAGVVSTAAARLDPNGGLGRVLDGHEAAREDAARRADAQDQQDQPLVADERREVAPPVLAAA